MAEGSTSTVCIQLVTPSLHTVCHPLPVLMSWPWSGQEGLDFATCQAIIYTFWVFWCHIQPWQPVASFVFFFFLKTNILGNILNAETSLMPCSESRMDAKVWELLAFTFAAWWESHVSDAVTLCWLLQEATLWLWMCQMAGPRLHLRQEVVGATQGLATKP